MGRFWIGLNYPNMLQIYPYDFDRFIREVSDVMLVFFFFKSVVNDFIDC